MDIKQCINQNAYLCYFDPSPLLPSSMIKNYFTKLYNLFNTSENYSQEIILKVISIRDKISKLSEKITLNDSFYLEVKFVKDPTFKLSLKP